MIPYSHMIGTLKRFRKICLNRYKRDFDMVSPKDRSMRLDFTGGNEITRMFLLPIRPEPIEAICNLAKTPRLLKLILRRTFQVWEKLHGEIDFDDLLVGNVIRFSAPEGFEFILRNIQEIRRIKIKGPFDNKDKLDSTIQSKFTKAIEGADFDTTSVNQLVNFLFPCLNKKRPVSPQNFEEMTPTDHWSRFLSEDLDSKEIRDQTIISSLKKWKEKTAGAHFGETTLPEALNSIPEFCEKFEVFAKIYFDGFELRDIATELFALALNKFGVRANSEICPGFIPLWRTVIRNPIDNEKHLEWVRNEFRKALSVSFRFANDIYYYYRSNSEEQIRERGKINVLRDQTVAIAMDLFGNFPKKLIEILDPTFMYSSSHFCILYSSAKEGGPGFDAQKWKWFTRTLLQAGFLNAQVIVPQIACLLVEEKHLIASFEYSYDNSLANELFDDQVPILMNLLAAKISLDAFDEREASRIKCAHEEGKRRLSDNDNS